MTCNRLIQSTISKHISTYVYSTELLHEHNKEGALGCPAVTADSEEFFPGVSTFALSGLNLEKLVGVVHIASSLDFVFAKTAERVECLIELALLHVPL
jgi:hypothetical protein